MGLRMPSLVLAALVAGQAAAFVPRAMKASAPPRPSMASTSARALGVDPSVFQDMSQQMQHLSDAFASTSMTLSDAMDAVADIAQPAVDAASSAVQPAADVVEEVAKKDNGWFGFLTEPISLLLQLIHAGLTAMGMNENSWGISIVALTVLIKVLTFPLTKTQLESTNKMQALQPAVKEVQDKYQSNPEVMNQKIAELYQVNEVNPLAGCLPSLVQIPVFIGLYRSVLDLAQENKLDEPFLFLPNLEGPTYGADPAHGSDWLFQGWVDGAPSLGWPDTIAFLALPIFLVISQVVSMQLMQPKDGPQQDNVVLKILPVMIGWFALNVPAALTIYWVVNNIVTTATTVAIRNSMNMEPVSAGGSSVSSTTSESASTIFAPPREKPSGFADVTPITSDVKPITSDVKPITSDVVDVEVSKEDETVSEVSEPSGTGMDAGQPKRKKGKRGKKRKKN